MSTLTEILLSAEERFSYRTAVIEDGVSVTYGDLARISRGFASFLSSRGIKKGDRVAIFLPNSIEFVTAVFGASLAGAVSVPVNSTFKTEEVAFYLEHSGARLIVTSDELEHTASGASSGKGVKVVSIKGEGAGWKFHGQLAGKDFDALAAGPEDEAVYLYSTGSTGKPKRVARTHYNLSALADNHTQTVGWTCEDRILFAVPISHTYAFGNFISAVKSGATVVVSREFNRNRVLDLLERERITVFPAVPVMLDVLSKTHLAEPGDFTSLKLVISAGAPLQERTFFKFHERFSVYPRQLYGSTETGVISINLCGEDEIETRRSSVGRPVKNVIVKVFGEDGFEVAAGMTGEIAVKSPSMTTGYYGLPEETARVFRDGYYFTGDLGFIDEAGYIYIKGRKKFLINVGGFKVDPEEVESLLSRHPDVVEAAVLGITDNLGNERVKAVIVARRPMDVKDVLDFLKDRIAGYKLPALVEFRPELPRSPAGKILRERLK
ncbi:MAG: class I adenylate-forming enzyme family protein [Thermodesulfobacteriota bacterium]